LEDFCIGLGGDGEIELTIWIDLSEKHLCRKTILPQIKLDLTYFPHLEIFTAPEGNHESVSRRSITEYFNDREAEVDFE
jgi:hypothetical protein